MKNTLLIELTTDTGINLAVSIRKGGHIRIVDTNIPKRQAHRVLIDTNEYREGGDPLGVLTVKNIARFSYIIDIAGLDGSVQDMMIESIRESVAALLLNETSAAAHEYGRALHDCIIASINIVPPGFTDTPVSGAECATR
jgi:hypothetical protein